VFFPVKLGDTISTIATPIARTLGLPCVDPVTKQLRPESGCAKRRQSINNFGDAFYDYFFKPETRKENQQMKFTVQITIAIDAENPGDALTKATPPNGELISVQGIMPRPQPMQRPVAGVTPPIKTVGI
jgi:hypothetical protein